MAVGVVLAATGLGVVCARRLPLWNVTLTPTLEDRLPDGSLYNPSTQSFLRESHWLDRVDQASITVQPTGSSSISLRDPEGVHTLKIQNIRLDYIVPRLHYTPASPPDQFDAFNLMLAEFSRNSLSVPVGKSSDEMAHFETDTDEVVPWSLAGDYQFVPNPNTRPVRFAVINNCLAPTLWELTASDRTGEIYHSWFTVPELLYRQLLARANGVDPDFAVQAVQWSNEEVSLELDRLRVVGRSVGRVPATVIDQAPVSFSSQDSRRKLHEHFVQVHKEEGWIVPQMIADLTVHLSKFSDFIEPGIYSFVQRKTFDFSFLRGVESVDVSRVSPRTHYNWRNPRDSERSTSSSGDCLELTLNLGEYKLIIGNLPIRLLVPQEDYVIHGFGVGILSSAGLAERRRFLIEEGPPPSYAYLCREVNGTLLGLNSHERGIEQLFIRTHSRDKAPWWEITVASYERIVDIVKFRVEVPAALQEELRDAALEYVSPLYFTYRDDNLR